MSEVEKGNDVATHLDKNQRNINEAVDLFHRGKGLVIPRKAWV